MTVKVKKEQGYNEIIANAKRVGLIAEEEATQADENSTISQNVIDAIVEGELHRLILPKEYGYPQIDFKTFTNMVKTVGYHNLSAAWLTYFYSLHNSWVSYLPKHRMDEIVEDGGLAADIFAPVGKVRRVEGGFLLSGQWDFVSGVNYSTWISLGAMYKAEGESVPERLGLCMRVSELQVIKNWDSLGLRGSGSNTVIADNIFVPDDMVLRFPEIIANRKPNNSNIDEDYLYYNVSFFPAFYVGFPAMALGAAERVLHEFKERTKKRVRFDGTNEGQSPKGQRVLAELTLKYKSALGLMDEYIRMLETDEGQFGPAEYNGIRVKIVQDCVDIAVKAILTIGASGLAKGNTMEIMMRDLIGIGTHITSLYEDGIYNYGKHLFDVPTAVLG